MDVAIAEFEAQKVFKGLEERLVEMKMRKLDLFIHQSSHRVVNTLDGLLRYTSILVAGCFHEVRPKDAPNSHYVYERPPAFDALEHHLAQPREQQDIQFVIAWLASSPPNLPVLGSVVRRLKQLLLARFAKCRKERAKRAQIQLQRGVFEESIDVLRQCADYFRGVIRRENSIELVFGVGLLNYFWNGIRC